MSGLNHHLRMSQWSTVRTSITSSDVVISTENYLEPLSFNSI